MAQSTGAVQPSSQSSNWIPWLIVGFLVGVFTLTFYYSTTRVQGLEFNPGTWQVRQFSFRADPFTGLQYTGIQYDNQVAKVDKSITALLDRKVRRENDRWELASIEQFASDQTGPCLGIVQLISGYGLARGGEAVEFWKKWTAGQPNKAKVFWPAVQELSAQGAYDSIPDLLDLPLVESDDQRFFATLSSMMGKFRPEVQQAPKLDQVDSTPVSTYN